MTIATVKLDELPGGEDLPPVRRARRPPSLPGSGMTGAQRSRNWYALLSPEKREARRAKEREWYRARTKARKYAASEPKK